MKKFLKISFCSTLIIILASCSRTVDDSCRLPDVIKIDRIKPYHKVTDGETVGSIAQKYKMTRAELIKLNNLQPPYQLYNGQKLVVNIKVNDTGDQVQEDADVTVTETAPALEPEKENNATVEPGVTEDKTIDDIGDIEKEVQEIKEEKKVTEYVWPIKNRSAKISKKFGDDGIEGGIVINSSAGTPVRAIADGIVIISGVPSGEASAYGVTVAIKHPNKKKMSIYSYLKETNVEIHQTVRKGDIIGKVGKTGTRATEPQLYFEISDVSGKGRRSVNPETLIPKE